MSTTPPIDDREPSLAEHFAVALSAPEVISAITKAVFDNLRPRIGGRRVYVASTSVGSAQERLRRIEEIRQKFNGRNRKQLCAEYNVSRATFYRIISSEGLAERARDLKAMAEAERITKAIKLQALEQQRQTALF